MPEEEEYILQDVRSKCFLRGYRGNCPLWTGEIDKAATYDLKEAKRLRRKLKCQEKNISIVNKIGLQNSVAHLELKVESLQRVIKHLIEEIKKLDLAEKVVASTAEILRRHQEFYHANRLEEVLRNAKKVNDSPG